MEALINAAISSEAQEITTVSWDMIAKETKSDSNLSKLIKAINEGFRYSYPEIHEYTKYKDSLYVQNGVAMLNDRAIIPKSLRPMVLRVLHSAHQGVLAMGSRARAILFWPGITLDIERARDNCSECNRNAPSQAHLPSSRTIPPKTPFEKVYADFFQFGGKHYLIVGDRLSGWTDVYAVPTGTPVSGARGLVRCLRVFFATYGVPEEISTDGGPEFMANTCKLFLRKWGVEHRVSSAYFPRSNGRAKVAVKAAKRLLRTNVGPGGSLNNDRFLQAILQHRNTPDPGCDVSAAEILFGRPIRDTLSFASKLPKFSNPAYRRSWRETWAAKENALRLRYATSTERLNFNSRDLQPLKVSDRCLVQNQYGKYPRKWDRSGIVREICPFDQYLIQIDGSKRLTKRNRKFLRRIKPASSVMERAPSREWEFRDVPRVDPATDVLGRRDNRAGSEGASQQQSTESASTQPVPLALRQLRRYNNPGLKEDTSFPRERLRPRQVR